MPKLELARSYFSISIANYKYTCSQHISQALVSGHVIQQTTLPYYTYHVLDIPPISSLEPMKQNNNPQLVVYESVALLG